MMHHQPVNSMESEKAHTKLNCKCRVANYQLCEGSETRETSENVENHNDTRRRQQAEELFSQEMMRDQERLLTCLKQQGIADTLIQRQFNRLVQEQKKQITARSGKANDVQPKKSLTSCETPSNVTVPCKAVIIEPKQYKNLKPGKRNNGLQEAPVLKTSTRNCKTASAIMRLNGTQDRSETNVALTALGVPESSRAKEIFPAPMLANGLQHYSEEEILNAVNAHLKAEESRTCDQEHQNASSNTVPENSMEDVQFTNSNEYDTSNIVYEPTLQEPQVFGGFTYFTRKTVAK